MALRTDREIAAIKSTDKPRLVLAVSSGAGGGLCIEVRSAGRAKAWLYRYRFNGRARKYTLGSYPAMSLAQARIEHAKAVGIVKAGEDPALVARAAKAKLREMPTFGSFFTEWLEWKQATKPARVSTIESYCHTYRRFLQKALGGLLVKDVSRSLLFTLLSKVRAQSLQDARKALTICAQMLDHAVNLELIELNPARTIKPSTIGAEAPAPRQRWLSRDELALFWQGLNSGDVHTIQANCLRLILLTGARRSEATDMRWEQVYGNQWVIPADKAKNGKEHTITLHPLALDILARQRALSTGSPWVFEAIRDKGQGHLDGNALRWVLNRVRAHALPQSEPFTVHDLRRSFASGCAEYLDANEGVIELALNHSKRDRLVATYQAGKRAEQVARLFVLWGDFIQKLCWPVNVSTDNVVTVNFGAGK